MVPLFFTTVLLVAFALGFILFARMLKRKDSPRQNRWLHVWGSLTGGLLAAGMAVELWNRRSSLTAGTQWIVQATCVVLLAGCALYQAYLARRRTTPREALLNYVTDSSVCGQCGYNLTGNVSGICPECGWAIPARPPLVERRGWVRWWEQWDIQYLENWKKSLASMALLTFSFGGLFVFGAYKGVPAVMVLAGLLLLNFTINVIRVIAYARRLRGQVSPPAQSSPEQR